MIALWAEVRRTGVISREAYGCRPPLHPFRLKRTSGKASVCVCVRASCQLTAYLWERGV